MKTEVSENKKRRMVFHLPFQVDRSRVAASQIRPVKMLQAFSAIGYEVFEVTGNVRNRREKFNLLRERLTEGQKFDFCYSETSTMPSLLTEDHHLPNDPFLEMRIFSLLKKHGIPVGVFYRDIYWKFDAYKAGVGILKSTFATVFYHVDFWMYHHYVDTIFLPTERMAKYLPQKLAAKSMALPPGSDLKDFSGSGLERQEKLLTFIYVGGVKPPHYDLQPLFSIARQHNGFRFDIVCRREEWELVKDNYSLSDNVRIVHASGSELSKVYKEADIFLNIRRPDEYLHFSMPMKIYEAIQEGKPIITSNLHEIAHLVSGNGLGWVIDEIDDFDLLLTRLERDRSLYESARKNISEFIKFNTWNSRAQQAKNKLLNEDHHSNRSQTPVY